MRAHSVQLKAQVRASASATKAAKENNDKADVKIAQALKMMESSQHVMESAEHMTKDYEAMRLKLYRLERIVAAARGAEPHEKTTRKSELDAVSTEAERLQAAASEFLNGVAEDAGSDGERVTPSEELKRTSIQVPFELKRKPEAAALIRLLKALSADHLTGNQIVLLVALTSVFHGLCPSLASNLDDARAVIEETIKVIKAAATPRPASPNSSATNPF